MNSPLSPEKINALTDLKKKELSILRPNWALVRCLETIIESGQDTRTNYLNGYGDRGFAEIGKILFGANDPKGAKKR